MGCSAGKRYDGFGYETRICGNMGFPWVWLQQAIATWLGRYGVLGAAVEPRIRISVEL